MELSASLRIEFIFLEEIEAMILDSQDSQCLLELPQF